MDDEILTAEQVANILKVHRFTVLKFIRQGKLKASKLGRVYRIRKSEVDRFLDDQMEHSTKKKTVTKTEPRAQKTKKPAKPVDKSKSTEKKQSPQRKNDNDVDHYVLRINDKHDL